MNCEALQTAIPDLLYGSLADDEAQAVNAHLAECAGCNRLVDELRPIPGALSKPAPPADLAVALKLAARDELLEQRRRAGRRGPLHLAGTIGLAMCLAVVGFALGVRWEQR
ncbi:MAG: zf-HC2 domain-containing protein, partial [Planctomycetes bacterium]|nr:zf-HC2 domain-containing protein [Planctomycetota bacterium]